MNAMKWGRKTAVLCSAVLALSGLLVIQQPVRAADVADSTSTAVTATEEIQQTSVVTESKEKKQPVAVADASDQNIKEDTFSDLTEQSGGETEDASQPNVPSEAESKPDTDNDAENASKEKMPQTVAAGWQADESGIYYLNADGQKVTGWQDIDGKRYYFQTDGILQQKSGWQTLDDGQEHYFDTASVIIDGTITQAASAHTGWLVEGVTTYYLDANGIKMTGWQDIDGNWYYLNDTGAEVKVAYVGSYWVCGDGIWRADVTPHWFLNSVGWWYGDGYGWYAANSWEYINGAWYWFDGNGYMAVGGWHLINGAWYYMNSSGAMMTGWQKINGNWYYMNNSGAMVSTTYVGNYWVCGDGVWRAGVAPHWVSNSIGWWYGDGYGWYAANCWEYINGAWYWFDGNGYMVTGWRQIGGTWYYFNSSGSMAVAEYINGWWLDSSGAWTDPNQASWKLNSIGWWYGDASGWYAANNWYRINHEWYYFDQNGYMVTGWRYINNHWYDFDASGKMLHDTWVEGRYYLNAGGDMANELVIVLDAGHGGHDGGASHFGGSEKNMNLAIALACRNELQKYKGVRVYMTRSDDTFVNLKERSDYASRISPSAVLVSLHINASGGTGSEVWVQNNNYRPQLAAVSRGLGNSILKQLTALGLKDNGVKTRTEAIDTYPDGSLCDWYSINRESKKDGIPGLIVEHAYIDNYNDYSNYLSTNSALTRLGVADAHGIAAYFGLNQ